MSSLAPVDMSSGLAITPNSLTGVLATAALLSLGLLLVLWPRTGRRPLPPGPMVFPIIGNLQPASKQPPWKTYKQLADLYGPIISLQNGPLTTIVVSSWEILKMHLERRNNIYSSRPPMPFFHRVNGGLNASTLPYGPVWKAHRALRTKVMKPSITVRYRPLQDLETRQLLHDLLVDQNFSECLRRFVSSLFLTVAYGVRLEEDSAEVEELEEMNRLIAIRSESALAGRSMWSTLAQSLRTKLPCRGAPSPLDWEREADELHAVMTATLEKRLAAALRTPTWNWAQELQGGATTEGMSSTELAYVIGSIYEAALAPYQALRTVILAARLYPQQVAQVHQELDEVVGSGRLPQFDDLPGLPQTQAFVRETMRWRTLTPIGGPRAASAEDECLGFRIPEGAMVLVNQWALNHDEAVFPEASTFRPQRWIDDPQLPELLFGYGQRACPGRHMGQDSLSLGAARLFWAYRILPAMKDGQPESIDEAAMLDSANGTSLASLIADFAVSLEVRSADHRRVIEEQWMTAEKDVDVLLARINPAATKN
jgi:fumitremorgin C synthase